MNTDEERMITLLRLIPWEWDEEEPEVPDDLRDAIHSATDDDDKTALHRWMFLNNSTLDIQSALEGKTDRLSRVSMYLLNTFEGAPDDVVRAVGSLVDYRLGLSSWDGTLDLTESTGRRWVDEVCAVAWRIRTTEVARWEYETER